MVCVFLTVQHNSTMPYSESKSLIAEEELVFPYIWEKPHYQTLTLSGISRDMGRTGKANSGCFRHFTISPKARIGRIYNLYAVP